MADELRDRLSQMTDGELAAIVAQHDLEEWRPEVFPIAEEILRGRGVVPPPANPPPDSLSPSQAPALVPAIELPDPGLLPVAKSILKAARIQYFVTNEETQNLIGVGQLGLGYNPITGPPVIMVEPERLDDAQELLNLLLERDEGETTKDSNEDQGP